MIDYKLILILVLSIVLLYLYNKVDSLKNELIKINKSYKDELKKLELLLINTTTLTSSNMDSNFCKLPINAPKNKNVLNDINKNENLETELLNLVKEKNTTEFSATESDSESNLSTSENFVIYSNEKILDNNEINLVKKYENLENLKNSNDIAELFEENLSKSLSEKSLDSNINYIENNDVSNVINIQNLINKIDKDIVIGEEFEINDIKLNNLPSSYLEIIDSSNSNNEDENVKALSDSNIEILKVGSLSINSDLDYELSENNKDAINNENFTLNTDIQLDNFNTYKLYDLQLLAKENNLTTTKLQNGKVKNKTKKELYNELNKINLK